MRCYETITAHGTGYWGMVYKINLITAEYIICSKWSNRQSNIFRYEVEFISPSGQKDSRSFMDENERKKFLNENFVDCEFSKSLRNQDMNEREYFLSKLTNNKLISIIFIHDYLQLRFEKDEYFTFYTWPVIDRDGKRTQNGQKGYFDDLYSFIGTPLLKVDEYLDVGLFFEFMDGIIEVSLTGEKNPSEPEVAIYQSSDGIMKVWRIAEELI